MARDAEQVAAAARIQATSPGWLIMWSPWRRSFTAFACFAPVPVILDSVDPSQLTSRMAHVELRYRPHPLPAVVA